MKKQKIPTTPTQISKISDFFSKVPTGNIATNGTNNGNKRKFFHILHTENKGDHSIETCRLKKSPILKKIKQEENVMISNHSINGNINDTHITVNAFKEITPEKKIMPSSSMNTPKVNSGSASKNRKTPQSIGKGTPKKLFEKSPRKLGEFNVRVFESFIKMSPSTSNIKVGALSSPKTNGASQTYSPAQSQNECTPQKSPKPTIYQSPRARAKLSFLDCIDAIHKKENVNEDEIILSNGMKMELDSFFDDDFDALVSFEEEFKELNFNEPQHCKIKEIRKCDGKLILKLKSIDDGSSGLCYIEEFWACDEYYAVNDCIYIKPKKIGNNWVVNNENGWLIYEPDLLISSTAVVGSVFCKRKSVLADKFRSIDGTNKVMLIGTLVHTLLQQTLRNKLSTREQIEALLTELLNSKDTIKRLFENGVTREEIEADVQTFVPKLTTFLNEYVNHESLATPAIDNWQGNIIGIDDIEENLWCPELGVKGKIDVTISTNTGIMPLEIKTGRATVSLEHRGQVMLYIMMMNKFGYEVSSGLLLYLREGVLKEVKATPQEKRDVTILRNELAYYLSRNVSENGDLMKPFDLPAPLNNPRFCPKCSFNTICSTFLKYENHDLSRNKTMQEVKKNSTLHLSPSHLDYFLKWCNLLTLEEESNKLSKSIKQIYTIPVAKREAMGRCIIDLKIVSVSEDQNGLYQHTFEKDNCDNLMIFGIVENYYVVVSTNSRPAVAAGFVTAISATKINITLDRNLNIKYPHHLFHFDTYESGVSYSFNMTSLTLLLENSPRAALLRDIIIDKRPPTFVPKLPSVVAKKGAGILKRLNRVQQKAVLKALCANDFLLIRGMPGTGKSATIVALIELLVELGKSVIITSHTHSAIDNICSRLQLRGVDFIRLGSDSKIHANIRSHSEATLTQNCKSPQEMEEVYNKYKVIGVTCLGSGHPILSKRTVDVCIVDESTQVHQPSTLRPLYAAKTFILIGDPHQLAPLVRNHKAIKEGMGESLFERLYSSDGSIALDLNYRMNQTITNLANVFTYKGELKTANEDIATRTLQISDLEAIKKRYKDHPWLIKLMNTKLEEAVQLLDTGPVWQLPIDTKENIKICEYSDFSESQNYINIYEIAIVVTIVKALILGGVNSSDIGVIATYRAQVAQITEILKNVDVSTVDQFQGRDKNIVIYSCTKSSDPAKSSVDSIKTELLEDRRRLTVAITRAKRKLIIVGDVSTLQRFNTFAAILPTLEKHRIKFNSPWVLLNDF